MAVGDVTFFEEALETRLDGGWESADDVKCAICDNTTTPTAATATPSLDDFTEVGTAGTYVAGGTSLGNIGTLVTEAAGVMKFDWATNPTWAKDASNDTDAWWGILYNDTQAGNPAFAFVELDGPVDMAAGALTITWDAAGIYTDTIT